MCLSTTRLNFIGGKELRRGMEFAKPHGWNWFTSEGSLKIKAMKNASGSSGRRLGIAGCKIAESTTQVIS